MVYHIDFKTKKLVPLETTGLPLGAVVSYGDQANPRRRAVVTRIDADPERLRATSAFISNRFTKRLFPNRRLTGRAVGGWNRTKFDGASNSRSRSARE